MEETEERTGKERAGKGRAGREEREGEGTLDTCYGHAISTLYARCIHAAYTQ